MIILAAAVIISINNTGIIRESNKAVDAKEEKEIQHLVSLAWSEAYMEGNRTTEDLKASVDEKLKDYDLSGYKYTITEKGAFVDHVTKRADLESKRELNKYGFYYDYGYNIAITASDIEDSSEYALVFRENGSVDIYSSNLNDTFRVLVCVTSYDPNSCQYSTTKISLPHGQIANVVNTGAGIEIDGIELVCNYTVSSGLQRNFNYFGIVMESLSNDSNNNALAPMFIIIDDENNITVSKANTNASDGEEAMVRTTGVVTEIVKDKIFNVGELTEVPVDETETSDEEGNATISTTSEPTTISSLEHDIYVSYDGKQIIYLFGESRVPNILEAQVDFVYTEPEKE